MEADWLVLAGGKLEKGPVYVAVEGETIAGVYKDKDSITPGGSDLLHAHLVTPGFVDIHTHGIGVCV